MLLFSLNEIGMGLRESGAGGTVRGAEFESSSSKKSSGEVLLRSIGRLTIDCSVSWPDWEEMFSIGK